MHLLDVGVIFVTPVETITMLSGNVLPVVKVGHSAGFCHLKRVLILGKLFYKKQNFAIFYCIAYSKQLGNDISTFVLLE